MFVKVRDSLYSGRGISKLNIVLNVLIVIILLAILCEVIFNSLYKGIYIVQSSMRPGIIGATPDNKYGGDYVYVDPKAKPDYGDIVLVFKNEQTTIIKRAIAFGGDSVKLVNGNLYIKYKGGEDFVLVEESYVSPENNIRKDKNNFPLDPVGKVIEEGHMVAEGYMFLLGDNRDVSVDSRASGDFALADLYGVVPYWSLKYKSPITALHRFFKYDVPSFFGVDVQIKGIDY